MTFFFLSLSHQNLNFIHKNLKTKNLRYQRKRAETNKQNLSVGTFFLFKFEDDRNKKIRSVVKLSISKHVTH